ncbi:helix-turn-helix domain-containing protein [Acinetobacter venetianus]|uniref:helix-turn-helix domain-containing protein n=1 Tax=Acinetobacter venetianus TaxID=52133 RepID=UPI003A8CE76F
MSGIAVVDASIQRCAHNKENPYLMISVGVTRDSRLTVEDLGFLTILLDHPNNFKFNVPYLVKRCKLSKEKTRKLLKRLIDLGYVIANQVRQKGQFLSVIYSVFEKPLMLVKTALEPKKGEVKTISAVVGKSEHGETECGESATNKYDEGLNKREEKKNTNVCMSKKDLKILKVNVNDQDLINALRIRNVKPIEDQQELDAYLAEFNKKAEEYTGLSENQRIANLAVFIKRCIQNHKNNSEKSKKSEGKQGHSTNQLSIKQAFFFAKQLTSNQAFASKYCNVGESAFAFEGRIRQNLFNEKFYEVCKPFLSEMGLISTR